MDWRAAFKGQFIKAVEFGGKEPTLTISDAKLVKVEDEKTKKEKDKLVIFFREIDRGWIPCKTACFCVSAIAGSNDTATWAGKRLTLFCDPAVQFGSLTVEGVRVKGSPDLTRPIDVTIRLPKKKPFIAHLVPTGKGKASQEPHVDNGSVETEASPPSVELADSEGVLPDEPGSQG
jgi:hypothetical protein